MNFQKGIVKYKDRTDIECTYVTLEGVNYYLLELGYNHTLPNDSLIASTELVEAIDPMYHASHIGVLDKDGKVVIPFENRAVRLVGNNILLAELANPISENVVSANEMKSDSSLATKLVSTPALIKDRLNSKMNGHGRYVFNDQFSEATIYDLDGNNLIDNEYYSFIAEANNKLYFSKNTVDGEIREYSMLPEEVQNNVSLDEAKDAIDVSQVEIPSGFVDSMMNNFSSAEEEKKELEEAIPVDVPMEDENKELEEAVPVEAPVAEENKEVEETAPVEAPVAEESKEVEESTPVEAPVAEESKEVEESTPVEAPVAEESKEVEETAPVEAPVAEENKEVEETAPVEAPVAEENKEEETASVDDNEEEVALNISEDDIDLDNDYEESSIDEMIHHNEEKEEDPLKDLDVKTSSILVDEEDDYDIDTVTDVANYVENDSIVNDVSEYMNSLLDKYKNTQEENKQLQQENDSLKNTNDKLKESNDRLKSNLDKVIASRKILIEKSTMQEEKVKALNAKIDAMNSKIQDLQKTVTNQNNVITSQSKERNALEEVLTRVKDSLEDTYTFDSKELFPMK